MAEEIIKDEDLDTTKWYDDYVINLRKQVTELQIAVAELYDMLAEMIEEK